MDQDFAARVDILCTPDVALMRKVRACRDEIEGRAVHRVQRGQSDAVIPAVEQESLEASALAAARASGTNHKSAVEIERAMRTFIIPTTNIITIKQSIPAAA